MPRRLPHPRALREQLLHARLRGVALGLGLAWGWGWGWGWLGVIANLSEGTEVVIAFLLLVISGRRSRSFCPRTGTPRA